MDGGMCVFVLQLAKDHGGISKYIQISCLGASSVSPSKQLRTKAAAEEVTLQNFPEVSSPFLYVVNPP
jgi:NADH dehydrogenase (ubiquinone) 1 alpha subcomplex subunit 9